MDPAILALMIPIAPFLIAGLVIWTKHRERLLAAASSQTAANDQQATAEIERLARRVETLERIVTDRGYDLAAQIEGLRERPQIEQRTS